MYYVLCPAYQQWSDVDSALCPAYVHLYDQGTFTCIQIQILQFLHAHLLCPQSGAHASDCFEKGKHGHPWELHLHLWILCWRLLLVCFPWWLEFFTCTDIRHSLCTPSNLTSTTKQNLFKPRYLHVYFSTILLVIQIVLILSAV